MALPCIDCTMAFWQGVWLLVLLLQATSLPSISAIQGASSSASSSPPPMQVLPRWRWGLSSTPLHADTELRGDRTRSLPGHAGAAHIPSLCCPALHLLPLPFHLSALKTPTSYLISC